MGTLNGWDVVDANNDDAPPDGWPENTMNYSDVNDTGRAVQGTLKRFFADINGSLVAGGVADAYTLSLNESGYSAYFDGMMFACTIPDANATSTPTMDVNGIGTTTIVDNLGGALGVEALVGGGVYTFQHDGTNLRLVTGGIAVNGSSGEFLINQDGRIDAPGNLTYDSGDDIVISDPSLRVAEWIELNEQSAFTGSTVAGRGYLWVRDDAPSTLIFRDDAGNDTQLGAGGGGGTPALPFNSVQFNNAGSFGGDADFSYNGTTVTILNNTSAACLALQGSSVGLGSVMTITGDPTTGRVLDISSTGVGEAMRIQGSIEYVSGTINMDNGTTIAFEDGGGGSSSITQDGTNEFRITGGLNQGDMRLRTADPGNEIYFEHRDGADLFNRRSLDADSFTVRLYSQGNEIFNLDDNGVDINRLLNLSNASAGQIQFPATQNPSANDNTLDDYAEEQQFVVTMTPSGSGSITIDASNDELAYVKIGRFVWLQGEVSVLSVSSPTGQGVDIELPFTSLDAPGIHSSDQTYQSCRVVNLSGASDDFYECFIDRNSNTMRIRNLDGAGNLANNFQATTIVAINVGYIANA